MASEERLFIVVLTLVNLAAGLGLSVLIAGRLGRLKGRPSRVRRYAAALVGIYFLECVAFAAGMATQALTVGLALVWGTVFGLWLSGSQPASEVLRAALLIAVFTSLPSVSFGLLILAAKLAVGASIVSAAEGAALGIPLWVPWPLNTILGFSAALVVGTLVLKIGITLGMVAAIVRSGKGA